MESLFALQEIQRGTRARGAQAECEITRLRAVVPAPILARYERFAAQGKKAVAVVRNGVCGECHLRIPVGKLVNLSSATEVQHCGSCGRYLFLPAEKSGAAVEMQETDSPEVSARKSALHAG
jgi:predicted  nucleic acid-binding Zn-ribbon protein